MNRKPRVTSYTFLTKSRIRVNVCTWQTSHQILTNRPSSLYRRTGILVTLQNIAEPEAGTSPETGATPVNPSTPVGQSPTLERRLHPLRPELSYLTNRDSTHKVLSFTLWWNSERLKPSLWKWHAKTCLCVSNKSWCVKVHLTCVSSLLFNRMLNGWTSLFNSVSQS